MEIPNLYLWTKAKKEYQKLNSPIWVAVILTDNQLPFLISETNNTAQKERGIKMIESKNDTSKNLEKALQVLQQAKQRVANEKKKQNEKKRKAENHHKYIMGGIIVKYFPDCYRYDEGELNRILSVALQTRECQQIISKIKAESRETTPSQSNPTNAENESEGGTE